MDIHAIQAFLTIVDQGSFSEAAEVLHLTQPAISKRLAALEAQLGVRLIDRSQRELRLTDAGNRLLPHARRIVDEVHNARMAVAPDANTVRGELPIIASHHIGLHHLPRWLRHLRRTHPEITLSPRFFESDAAYGQILKRRAEIGFVTLSDSMPPGLRIHVQWPDPMAFVCGPDHPLAAESCPGLHHLAQHPALLPDTSTATYRVVSRLFLEANLNLSLMMPTNYLETIKMMTNVGLGWSVLPVSMVDNSLHVLNVGLSVSRMLGAVGVEGRLLSGAARALLDIVVAEEGS